jgi:hypothetical protein
MAHNSDNTASSSNRSITCPDCAVIATDKRLDHKPTCPIALGISEICEADRIWFVFHLGAKYRVRPITWAESAEMRAIQPGFDCDGVGVTYLADGLRARQFGYLLEGAA